MFLLCVTTPYTQPATNTDSDSYELLHEFRERERESQRSRFLFPHKTKSVCVCVIAEVAQCRRPQWRLLLLRVRHKSQRLLGELEERRLHRRSEAPTLARGGLGRRCLTKVSACRALSVPPPGRARQPL